LLVNKFKADCRDKNGRTPLDLACFKGESSCVECLLKNGASYQTHDSVNERTPLHAAAYNNNEECLKAIASYLDVENQSDFKSDLLDKFGRTPLMIAVEQGHLNTISLLINNMNADVLACDLNQRTALHRSVIKLQNVVKSFNFFRTTKILHNFNQSIFKYVNLI